MGWSNGTELFDEVIKIVDAYVEPRHRIEVHMKMISAFEDMDWDTQEECLGKDEYFDEALKTLHPEWELENEI